MATAPLLSFTLVGCATAPPLKGRADLLEFLADGKTSCAEVVRQLGRPSGKFEREAQSEGTGAGTAVAAVAHGIPPGQNRTLTGRARFRTRSKPPPGASQASLRV